MTKKSLYIVTGSSKGIGEALVNELLQAPTNQVIGISRSAASFDSNAYHHLCCDLGDGNAFEDILDDIFPLGDYEKIVLVNNAGWIGQIAHFGKLKHESIQTIFQINTIAPAILMNAFVQKYADQKHAERLVINISSGAARKAIDGWSGYSASKAALNMLSETAQAESERNGSGIRFFALSPGVVDTGMQEDIRAASASEFSLLEKFKGLKSQNELSDAAGVAKKILHLIFHSNEFDGVLQDVRDF
ncbi:SDR family NAD(P)-dependent oxidoreductase [Pararhodonellum marinum]|uniref:SDR family NAD(P)-dependent oxidoreductase n=1 Tax=Pararhodonellum marinum TaxID=2755358 RepID=UPI00188E7AB2|nr:SDR family NAD(P)-dependent oxidoreductase [Pararhodonellum marinum]